jgi:hypothetical protein
MIYDEMGIVVVNSYHSSHLDIFIHANLRYALITQYPF